MPVKMRLQRHGKKGKPFFHIVIADGRAPRDGKFIEKIGTYNPITNPADINLNFDKALDWLQKGAQPTDTVRAILSYKGVLYKNHLLIGVRKGALTEQEAEAKFQTWLKEKEARIEAKRKGLADQDREERKARLEEEAKINEERAAELAKKKAAEVEEQVKAAKEAAESAEAESAEAKKSEAEKPEAENTEEPKAQEEAPAQDENKETKEEEKSE
jgi:small subunit ribosomal protein S16